MRYLVLAFVLTFAILLSGCQSASPASPVPAPTERRQATGDGLWEIVLTTDPDPIPSNEHFHVSLTLVPKTKDAGPRPEIEAVDAYMPDHRHGMRTQPRFVKGADGRCRAEGLLFHMSGYWEIFVAVKTARGQEGLVFPVTLE